MEFLMIPGQSRTKKKPPKGGFLSKGLRSQADWMFQPRALPLAGGGACLDGLIRRQNMTHALRM